MSFTLLLRPEAEHELNEAFAWYEEQRPDLGREFLDSVESTFAEIKETPLLHPVVHRGVRRALIHRFPYGVFYLLEGDHITVLAVFHASRSPKHWRSRT